jgi:hypothetical protein
MKEALQVGFNIEIEPIPVHADVYVTGFIVEAYPTEKNILVILLKMFNQKWKEEL